MIPKTENSPSMEPKTSSALRLPVSSTSNSVLCTARTGHPQRGTRGHDLYLGMSMLLLDDTPDREASLGLSECSL
jgi:hypothetical protein